MKKIDVVRTLLGSQFLQPPKEEQATAFAPANIALCKYWGKRDQELNLPITSSLSISLPKKGATIHLKINQRSLEDTIVVNDHPIALTSAFGKRLIEFINLFREQYFVYFDIDIQSNIPIAAGMASSAAGFASVVLALNQLYGWKLDLSALSIFARLGSGSASRSLWQGFVEWKAGIREDGMDSFGEPLALAWPDLCIGLCLISEKNKGLSSRDAMQRTVTTSSLFAEWPTKVKNDLQLLKSAIHENDFDLLGKTAESNALSMHATMMSAWPPVLYSLPNTVLMMRKIWQLREEGYPVYFTQDAGPNLKLLFLKNTLQKIQQEFPDIEIVQWSA